MKTRILIAAISVFAAFLPMPSSAQNVPCFAIGYRQDVLIKKEGHQVVETHVQPAFGKSEGIVTWEMWRNPETAVWSLTAHAQGFICLHYRGQSAKAPEILNLISDTRDKPQGTSL